MDVAGGEVCVAEDGLEEGNVGFDALDAELGQGAQRAGDGIREVRGRGVGDHLGQQRVVVQARLVAAVAEAVGAHARAAGSFVGGEYAACGDDGAVLAHGLHADAGLDGVAPGGHRRVEAQVGNRGALRQPKLGLHDVDASDLLRHRVLHLQPGVGLDEGEVAAGGGFGNVHQKLERAGAQVVDAGREPNGRVDHRLPNRLGETRRRRHLDNLLEAPLHAALALAEMRNRAAAVAEHLDFDVPGAAHELLDVEVAVAEAGQRLGAAALVGLGHLFRTFHHARAAAPAAAHRLQHHGAAGAEASEELLRLFEGHGVVDAANHRHSGFHGGRPRPRLVAEEPQRVLARPHEGEARLGTGPCQLRVLRKEAVAGMHRVAAGLLSRPNDRFDIEIGRRPDALERHHLVRLAGMQRAGVVLRRNRHGGDAEFRRPPHDANGNLAPIGDQQLHLSLSLNLHRSRA